MDVFEIILLMFMNISSHVGVYTQYKPFLNKDKSIIKRLAKVSLTLDFFYFFVVTVFTL